MKNLPTLRQLQYLIALSIHKNFQKAADDCGVSQSTLSGGIADLEDILKSPVIDRTSRTPLKFTPLGLDVIRTGHGILEKMEDITGRALALNAPLSWPLKMGVIPTIAPYLLPRLLKPLQKALPNLDLHIHEMRSSQIIEKLDSGDIDFALMAFPYDTGVFDQTVLFEEKFLCAAPPHHFKDKKTITQKDLDGMNLLLLEDGHCLRDHALAACKVSPNINMKNFSAASLSTLIQLVHEGYGLTLLPDMVVSHNTALPKTLTLRPFSSGAPTRKIGFCFKNGGFRHKDIKLVVSAASEILKSHRKD